MNTKARFEKVSLKRFIKDYKNTFTHNVHNDNYICEIYNKIKLPERSTIKSAGYDFYMPFYEVISYSEGIMIPTGIRCVNMADDEVLMIYPRSGLGSKYRFVPANLVGIIDADYADSDNEGHIFMKMVNDGSETLYLDQGKAFCQGIITKFCITDNKYVTRVRNGGFGSTNS